MTLTDFKTRLAGFMTRVPADFVNGSVDQLLEAINDARRAAQRTYVFQTLRDEAYIQTSIIGSDFRANMKSDATGTGTAVKVRNIEKIWEFQARTIPAGTLNERTAEVDFRTDRSLGQGLPLAGTESDWRRQNNYITANYTGRTIGWVKGAKVYTSSDTTNWYLCEIVKLAPDLTDDASAVGDFFLDFGADWLLFASAQVLNGYLKEDQRVAISAALLSRSWETLTNFDSSVNSSNDAGDLD